MATEAVNGYDQFSQPAELAASTPAHGASSSQSSNAASSQKPDPQEIGWYFVEQYYTTLSKSPDKIHLFYNKKSQLITGVEAEKVLPAVGSKAISEKIKSLDISDCKIRVLNVDCQSSYDNIVVQVIGEISNKNQPHHKFVQTFILAPQPNGYFVLNDIFRYLSEDEDEVVDDEPAAPAAAPTAEEATEESKSVPTPAAADEVVNTDSAVQQVDEELQAAAEDPSTSVEEVNGTSQAPSETTEPVDATKAESEAEEPARSPSPQPAAAAAAAVAEPESTQTPAAPAAATAAAADGPPVKKTWANMVGTKAPQIPALPQTPAPAASVAQPKAQPQRPVQTAATPKAPVDAPVERATTPTSQSNGWQEAGKKTRQQPKAAEGIVHAYIKNVNDKIDARVLRDVLEKYGKLKYYDVSRPKQCAFVEFEDPAAYAAAVADNPHTVGSETINVEERRPRPGTGSNYGTSYNRGGANAGRGRGGPQPRSGSQSGTFTRDAAAAGGRGTFQGQRGSGTKAAGPTRGRGQGQGA